MDDTLEYNKQENKSLEEWHLGEGEESISSVPSRYLQQNQDLQVIQKREVPLDRPIIQATMWERLAYYRSYATSQTKIQFVCMQQENFTTYLWNYLGNVFFKSLSTTYVYAFFSAYAPDSHFFISRILPIAHGSSIAFILTAFIELIMVTHDITRYLDYFIMGLIFKGPWNRCPPENLTYVNKPLKCFEEKEFAKQFVNKTIRYSYYVYISPTSEYFQLAQMLYYLIRSKGFGLCDNIFCVYFVVLWIGATSAYKAFFKRFIWKTLSVIQMALNIILFVSLIHLTIVYFDKGFKKYPVYGTEILEVMQDSDIDLLSESMTTPPIIHILSSRSNVKNKPIYDSALIVTSNAVYYTFRGFVAYLLKLYCDNLMNTSLQESYLSSQSLFYLWPIYFSQFHLGHLFEMLFFLFNFINEYLVIVITLQCLIEAIVSEWRWLKPWMVIVAMSILGITSFYFTSLLLFEILYVLCKSVATLMEVIIIFYIYPLGRLVDDLTFFNGIRPTKLRLVTFWTVPIFYLIKFYTMITGFFKILKQTNVPLVYPNYEKFIYILAIPMIIGALYAVYKYVFVMKMGWTQLFKPLPSWGPSDFATRQLRKRYDSRLYIESQAPRELSRFLIEKSELNAYKLDVRYDTASQRSSQRVEVATEVQKKNI